MSDELFYTPLVERCRDEYLKTRDEVIGILYEPYWYDEEEDY